MARTDNLTNFLTDIADAIRNKTGGSNPIAAEDFDTEIAGIPTGGGLAYETGTYTPSEDTQEPVITFSNQHSDVPCFFMMNDVEPITNPISVKMVKMWMFIYCKDMTGISYQEPYGTQTTPSSFYGIVILNVTHVSTAGSSSTYTIPFNKDKGSGNPNKQSPDFYADSTNNSITAKAVSSSSTSTLTQVYKAGRTYKWIAVWR